MSREDFLRIPELAINPLGDRIVHAFFFESKSGDEDKVDFKDFVRVLAHFRPIKKSAEKNKLNTRMEKLHFAFRMYDLDGDDKISKEELLAVLTMMVGNNISTEQLISIAERTIMEADLDKVNSNKDKSEMLVSKSVICVCHPTCGPNKEIPRNDGGHIVIVYKSSKYLFI